MRGRPLKVDQNANLEETLRRARGRAAQRRYRHRQEQTLADNEARIEKLESVVQGMINTFLDFGDQVTRSMAVPTHNDSGDLGTAYHEAVKKFRNLAAEVDEDISWPQDQALSSTSDDTRQAANDTDLQLASRGPSKLPSTAGATYEVVRLRRPPCSKASSQTLAISQPALSHNMQKFLSPAIISMPVLNPVLSADYLNIEELSFSEGSLYKRLLHYGMLRNYQALRCDDPQDKRNPWSHRVHRFSLRHSTKWNLLFLTRLALEKMSEESCERIHGPAPPSRELPDNEFFGSEKHRSLATAIQHDLELEGILSDIVRAEEIEDYLAQKGTTRLEGNRLELRLFSGKAKGCRTHGSQASSPHEDIQTVIIDTERFMQKLCDQAICLGNGMGFSKHIVNDVIVYSAVHMGEAQ
ncbi:uncharacterized protein PV07_01649 [Cladophialophora immunda]|uniref:BZIP domain-containing protein n=1 Tax=Cladophialophora immunda TaxID=569365 RepID=A0A0D2BBG1_9EURO|nr:uncharacterized protein PV07_01649 [Cladophialophora immunda]KIW34907.1 hypothetical protein PV07_01649 [Cladophialophora immunda]